MIHFYDNYEHLKRIFLARYVHSVNASWKKFVEHLNQYNHAEHEFIWAPVFRQFIAKIAADIPGYENTDLPLLRDIQGDREKIYPEQIIPVGRYEYLDPTVFFDLFYKKFGISLVIKEYADNTVQVHYFNVNAKPSLLGSTLTIHLKNAHYELNEHNKCPDSLSMRAEIFELYDSLTDDKVSTDEVLLKLIPMVRGSHPFAHHYSLTHKPVPIIANKPRPTISSTFAIRCMESFCSWLYHLLQAFFCR